MFDNGTLQSGVFAQAKQFGSILRGAGPPVPAGGVVGDVYLDTQTFFLYNKRSNGQTDQWGHYLFQVPVTYRSQLKWYTTAFPPDEVGIPGDYCLTWGGYPNYGLQPAVFGPRGMNGWNENGNGPDTEYDPLYAGFVLPIGLEDEGTPQAFSGSTQLIVEGIEDEYILAIPITYVGGTPISQIGLQSYAASVTVVLNPLYTAKDEHGV